MDIEKERELFEAYMAEKYKNLVDRRLCLNNGGGYMAWDMNVAWQVWQAAKAQAVPDQVLDAPACVGGGTFQKGVKWSTVIAAAQRHFKYTQNAKKAPSLDIDQVKKLVSGDFVLVSKEKLHEWKCMAQRSEELSCPDCYESRGYSHNLAEEIEAREPAND